jgi:hypothetical protein
VSLCKQEVTGSNPVGSIEKSPVKPGLVVGAACASGVSATLSSSLAPDSPDSTVRIAHEREYYLAWAELVAVESPGRGPPLLSDNPVV